MSAAIAPTMTDGRRRACRTGPMPMYFRISAGRRPGKAGLTPIAVVTAHSEFASRLIPIHSRKRGLKPVWQQDIRLRRITMASSKRGSVGSNQPFAMAGVAAVPSVVRIESNDNPGTVAA